MIKNFTHKGLKRLYEKGNISGIQSKHKIRLRRILALLATSSTVIDMNLPGLNLHELKGNMAGTWSVKVSGNWRLTFKIESDDVHDIDY
ncbi:MAG: type II toxin-antitoxin system RelE/ParE family toxin [Candidatus Marinimicrobia bacterium]|nr:type II toxin-antitoxin system RelE/ParE family toxin [Candidatus Neomarinimicrobiota bacterium]